MADFIVTTRNSNGSLVERAYVANDRSDLFKKLSADGVVAVRIREGVISNRSRKAAKASGKTPSVRFGFIGAVVAVAGIVAAVLFFLNQGEKPVEKPKAPEKKQVKVVDVKPAKPAPKPVEVTATLPKKKVPKWRYPVERTNELSAAELRKWKAMHRPPPGYTNNTSLTEAPPKYAIFKHRSENEIASLLTLTPGAGLVGTPVYTKRLTEDFLKSLETPIIVTEEDSEEDAELKRAMIQTKIELKDRIDAGEDLGQILLDTRREYQELARYKTMLKNEIAAVQKNPDASMQDVEDFVTAANKLLEEKGIAPLNLSPISKRMLLQKKGKKK